MSMNVQAGPLLGIQSRHSGFGGHGMPNYGPSDLLTEQQLANELHKSRATLARWRRTGTGPAWLRIGKSPMYRWADVERWLAERRDQPQG
jgi:predicted DNA-binding transcriptional regulator AlpA